VGGTRTTTSLLNDEEASKEAAAAKAISGGAGEQLRKRRTSRLVGNHGYRRYRRRQRLPHFAIDEAMVVEDAAMTGGATGCPPPKHRGIPQMRRCVQNASGRWNTVRSCKSLLRRARFSTSVDETIRGPCSCAFLRSWCLSKELQDRLGERRE